MGVKIVGINATNRKGGAPGAALMVGVAEKGRIG